MDYTDKAFKVEYHNLQNLITKSDNGSDNNLQNLITKSVLEQKLKEYSQNLITKSAKINHNIDNTIIDNTYKNNIGPNIGPNNNIIYISEQEEKEKSNSKLNCFLTKEEIESYDNSNYNNLKKEELKENIDNSKLDNITANAESVNSNKENLKKKGIESNNLDNSNSVNSENNLDNSNEVNTAVLSRSNQLNEESVISTEKMSENGLKQAKTRELGIVKKTDNSNNVNSNTANAVTEETVYSNIDNSKEVEGNNNLDNSNSVKPVIKEEIEEKNKTDNSNEGISKEKLEGNNNIDNSKNVIPDNKDNNISTVKSDNSTANAELESNNSVNSNSVNSENNLDNSNSVKPVIEEENKTDNSNECINNTIAEGDNSTANAVQEFRNKCTKYTIILEGKKIEIDRSVDEFIESYFNELNNNIYDTKEFDKQRKIFNKMIVDNQLTGVKYDEMCDKLDIRFAQYNQVDKEVEKSNKEKEFTQEEAEFIANELLDRCLNCGLDEDNNLTNFYNYRNQYNWFIEEYGINKEGLKLQKKYSELTSEKKKRNESVKAKAFAN